MVTVTPPRAVAQPARPKTKNNNVGVTNVFERDRSTTHLRVDESGKVTSLIAAAMDCVDVCDNSLRLNDSGVGATMYSRARRWRAHAALAMLARHG